MGFDLDRADTICALATAPGVGALAVVRVSGKNADAVRARVFRPRRSPQRPFVATRGDVLDDDAVLDDAMCVSFPAGRSFTGEAGFELTLHGGPVPTATTLQALQRAGCRLAEPGEFSLRAVLNGRLDLTAAEAIPLLSGARTRAAARAALATLRGGLAAALAPVRAAVVDGVAELEARLDFPDEDLGAVDSAAAVARLVDARARLARLLASRPFARRLFDGARVVLSGAPNAGKSTLLNALAGSERAIVHHTPGTTRDTLEVQVELGGVPVTLVDTAGLRSLDDDDAHAVERLGIERARAAADAADVLVAVVPVDDVGGADGSAVDRADLVVWSKADRRPDVVVPAGVVLVSAHDGTGLPALRAAIARVLAADDDGGEVVLANARQEALVRAVDEALAGAAQALQAGLPGEMAASELRRAGGALDALLGQDLSSDVLDLIFTRFCIGK